MVIQIYDHRNDQISIGSRSGVTVRSPGWETGQSEFDSRARRLLKARHDVKFIRNLRITTVNKYYYY
jgi:hypothetical protein